MRPAWSVILLTTLIGAGQGLFLAGFTVETCVLLGSNPTPSARPFYLASGAGALALLGAGLAASFFHLGRPQRAWRAATRWRTSWLSREVIVLPALMALIASWTLLHLFDPAPAVARLPQGLPIGATVVAGTLATLCAFALFVCTGMIYACLPFLAEWHTPLTPINFTLMGGASGFVLAAAIAALVAPSPVGLLSGWALVITALAALGRVAALWRNARLKPKSTIQSAIGIKHPVIAQKSQGFMGGSFNTREFFHGASPGRLALLRQLFVVLAFAAPIALVAIGREPASAPLLWLAFAVQMAGLGVERWFFFAQARHPQNLYYQAVS